MKTLRPDNGKIIELQYFHEYLLEHIVLARLCYF